MRSFAWLLLAGWASLGIAQSALAAAAPTTITVRFLPHRDEKRVLALLRRLAMIGEPERIVLAAGSDIEPVLRSRCGFVSDTLLQIIREENPGVALTALDRERVIDLPPCPFWRFGGSVPVAANESLPEALELFIGSSSDQLVRRLSRTRALVGKLSGNQALVDVSIPVEFTTEAVTIVLRAAYAQDPQKVVDDLASSFPTFVPDQLRSKFFAQGGDANFALVAAVVTASAQAANEECPAPSDPSRWPFDEALVQKILEDNFQRLEPADRRAATIVVADTGIDPADESWILLRRDGKETGEHARKNWDDDGNGFDDDIIGANLNPPPVYPGIESNYADKEHGTQVASMAQGVLRSAALRDVVRGRIQLSIARVVSTLTTANGTSAWFDSGSVIRSIKYAASIGAPVLNWSIESPRHQLELESQLLLSPTLLAVTAAGNSKTYLNQAERHPAYLVKHLPERVIVVGAHGPDGSPWKRSSYGDEVVDLSAPGCRIESMGFGGARKIAHGTSLAAPLVSFTAALLHAHGLDSAQDKKRRIVASTTPEQSLAKRVRSGGRLDIPKAIAVLDDVIVVRGENGAPDRMLRGRIDEPADWDVCGEINPIDRVEKVSPRAGDEPLSTRVILQRPGGWNAILLCTPPKGTLKFRELLKVNPDEYGPEQTHPIASLIDIVPAWYGASGDSYAAEERPRTRISQGN